MTDKTVGVLIGSLRKDSLNRKMAAVLAALAPAGLRLEEIGIGDLPLYNADLETESPPAAWTAFRDRLTAVDAFLFVTPEYNRSVPGALKNAIDVASRPAGRAALSKKPAAIVTVSPGAIGGFGANHHLRQMLVFLDVPVMAQPEAYIGGAGQMFGEDGELAKPETRVFLEKIMAAFAAHVERHSPT